MIKYFLILIVFFHEIASSQELFVSTEPASNMAKGSIGLRLGTRLFKMNHNGEYRSYRTEPEIMIGINKNIMVHITAYGGNMFQKKFMFEGAGLYGKYRIYSKDDVHKHFRLATFAKVSVIKNPEVLITNGYHLLPDGNGGFYRHDEILYLNSNDLDLDGNNSGFSTGIVATQLNNKVAFSASLAYSERKDNINNKMETYQPVHAIMYTSSAGLLLLPKNYTAYNQTNLNLYVELLGQSFTDKKQYYIDVAPAIQFIFNSISRLDLSYRTQMAGNVERLSNSYFMLRLEYNFLNVFNKK